MTAFLLRAVNLRKVPYRTMMSVQAIRCTTRADALLEGPHWDPKTQSLLYVEICSKKIHRYTPVTDSVDTVSVGKFI